MNPDRLLPPPTDDPTLLAQQALALAHHNPEQALALLERAANQWLSTGDRRRAALALHRRAALALHNQHSPIADLALAARLLTEHPEDRALVLLDLGQALAQAGDMRRATLALRESESMARRAGHHELLTAARHALGKVADGVGDYESARAFLREAGRAMIYDVESDLLAVLRDMGNLPERSRAEQERHKRQQAVEEELAELKRQMGLQ